MIFANVFDPGRDRREMGHWQLVQILKIKKACAKHVFCTGLFIDKVRKLFLFFLNLDYLLTIVVAAGFARAVHQLHLAALGALADAGQAELPVRGTTGISSRLGNFSFGCCHGYTSSLF